MPHVSIEFSNGISKVHDMQHICEELFLSLSNDPAFVPSELKIRAMPIDYYRLGSDPQSFVHATLLLLEGRDVPTKKRLNTTILNTLRKHLPDVGSITVQEREITRETYQKSLL